MAVVFTEYDPEAGVVAPSPRAVSVEVEGDGECHLCGVRAAEGVWYGAKVIQVCRRCALDALPGLIADAIVGHLFAVQARTSDRFSIPDPTYHREVAREIGERFSHAYLLAARAAERIPSSDGADARIGPPGRRGY